MMLLALDQASERRGILLALLATVAYAAVATLSKLQSRHYPVEMIVWVRYAFPLLTLLALYLPRRGAALLRTGRPGIQFVRGLLLTAGTVFIVFAYRVMPVAEAHAISFIHPILLTLLAVLFLGEKVNGLGWIAVVLGFAGVLLIVRPSGGLFSPVALLPLGMALTFSSYQMLTRLISTKENSINSLFYALLVGTLLMSLALPFSWQTPNGEGLFFFVAIGISSGVAHFSTIKALECAPASMLAPYAYLQLLWVSALGALVFGDVPELMTLAGMLVVVLAGLLVAASRSAPRRGG